MKTLSECFTALLLRDALSGLRSEVRKYNHNHDRLGRFASSRQYAPDKGTTVGGSTGNTAGAGAAQAAPQETPQTAPAAPTLNMTGDDASIKSWITSSGCKKTLKQKNYDKHAPGTAAYAAYAKQRQDAGQVAQSRLTISHAEAQAIIIDRAGTGEIRRDSSGTWTQKEFIDCGYTIGYTVDLSTGTEHATSLGTLHYSVKNGIHLVPR